MCHAAANRERKKEHQEQRRHLHPERKAVKTLDRFRKEQGNTRREHQDQAAKQPRLSSCRRAARPAVGSGPRPKGADPRSTRLRPSIRDQGGGRPRSQGTARSNFVSFRRSASGSTTERTAAKTSLLRFGRFATGQKIDDRRLRLSIAVEPVIGDHSSRNDDADPQRERKRAGNPGRPGRHSVDIPGDDPSDKRVSERSTRSNPPAAARSF